MGRQINGGVLLLINKVELSIYRFLTSGAKKNKKQPQLVERGSTGSLAIGAFNDVAGYRFFDRISTGPRLEVDREKGYLNREGKATRRERVFLTLLDWISTGQGEPVNRYPSQLSHLAQCLDRFNILALKTYIFMLFSLLNT